MVAGEIGTKKQDPAKFKEFLDGVDGKPSRFSLFCAAIERSIKGPYFYGEKPTYVDFFLGSCALKAYWMQHI